MQLLALLIEKKKQKSLSILMLMLIKQRIHTAVMEIEMLEI